jgi:hypothetical protein
MSGRTIAEIKTTNASAINELSLFRSISQHELQQLFSLLNEYAACKKPIVGYLFSKSKVAQLDTKFLSSLAFEEGLPSQKLAQISSAYNSLIAIKRLGDQFNQQKQTEFDLCSSRPSTYNRESTTNMD